MPKRKLQLKWHGYYSYNEDNVDDYVPEKSGVYKLSVELKNGKLKPFYVGQALDLNDRLNEHLSNSEENDCIKDNVSKYDCHFKFAPLSLQKNRDGAEKALYIRYKPECNDSDAIPNGPDIDINTD